MTDRDLIAKKLAGIETAVRTAESTGSEIFPTKGPSPWEGAGWVRGRLGGGRLAVR
jgi:hypothetical protein